MKIATFFAGAGGLDRGFEDAGFDVVWANEYDKAIWDTYRHNFPATKLDTRSIIEVEPVLRRPYGRFDWRQRVDPE